MKITGENQIAASREAVWEALNDADILRQSIPGCESLEKVSDTQFKATVVTKIGPIKAKFKGEVTLADLDPPNSYTLSGKGSGGSAGGASGSAKVALTANSDGTTLLNYDVDAKVGGKLAQLGSRLIDSTAKVLAGKFFTRFQEIVGGEGEEEEAKEEEAGAAKTGAAAAPPNMIYVGGIALAIALILYWIRS